MSNETEFVGFSDPFDNFFRKQIERIEEELYSKNYDKQICAEYIGRLGGAINFAANFNVISMENFDRWLEEYNKYRKINYEK